MAIQSFLGRSPIINIMTNACFEASRRLKRDFNEVAYLQVALKGSNDFVTAADHEAANTIIKILERSNPGHGIICEETETKPSKNGYAWVIDPLDGTRNFMHNLPYWGISIALIYWINELDYEVHACTFYDPIRDELFWAQKNQGAFLNDRRIQVSRRNSMQSSLFATGFTHMRNCESADRISARVRRLGSNTLHFAYLAAGRFDAVWEHVSDIWDIAVGSLLVREAKGIVTNFQNETYKRDEYVLASNGLVHGMALDYMEKEIR
jgi:myo-inositol-1(or 4)-monophosphatase